MYSKMKSVSISTTLYFLSRHPVCVGEISYIVEMLCFIKKLQNFMLGGKVTLA